MHGVQLPEPAANGGESADQRKHSQCVWKRSGRNEQSISTVMVPLLLFTRNLDLMSRTYERHRPRSPFLPSIAGSYNRVPSLSQSDILGLSSCMRESAIGAGDDR